MVESTDSTEDDQSDSTPIDDPTDGDLPAITCTLTTERTARRRDWVEEHLLPHLEDIRKHDDGFSFIFDRTPEVYAAVTELSWKESHCCAWATFDVELPPGDGPIRWNARSERTDGVEYFDEALRETLELFDETPLVG